MLPSKLHALFCLCTCLALVYPFDWQDLNPVAYIESPAWVSKIQALMAAANIGQSKIPRGNGSYSVGCTDLMFDYTNKGTFLRLYYPSQDDDHSDTLWIPNKEYFLGLSKFLGTHWLVGKIMGLFFGSMTTPAAWNAHLRTGEKYPLIIFSHGLGAFRTIYSAIGIDLASHGFIVAAVEHRDGSACSTYYFKDQSAVEIGNKSWLYLRTLKRGEEEFPLRNEQLRQRAKECSQALSLILDIDHGRPVTNVLDLEFDVEQLKDSIDRDKIAIIGHSFGGATVIQTLSEDQRFRCGIALDAWMFPVGDEVYSRIPQPLFFINSERFQYPSNIIRMKKCFLPDRERKMITIRECCNSMDSSSRNSLDSSSGESGTSREFSSRTSFASVACGKNVLNPGIGYLSSNFVLSPNRPLTFSSSNSVPILFLPGFSKASKMLSVLGS
uniref:1-alkyl-2-acetylglycerophosphocholine esterase n=1 Tax=Bos indicus x Bos taurus TaxID=30522 RepID=A0A4W2H6Q8_BOBOX